MYGKHALAILYTMIAVTGCSSPKHVEIKEVCGQAEETAVVVDGFLTLPASVETLQLRRGGSITEVGYKMHLTDARNGAGNLVTALIWTTNKSEPNRIKAISAGFSKNDLLAYRNDGSEIDRERSVRVSGTTATDGTGCYITVSKIEQEKK